jgi:outer membrane protein OmpA-like peptidoglycan-associated protein
MKLHRLLPSLAAVLVMAGCAGIFGVANQQAAHSVQPVADPFQRNLYEGYLRLGDKEVANLDPVSAPILFDKAIAAGQGREVPVADPDWWNNYRGHPWAAGRWRTMITGAVRVRAYDYRDRLVPWIAAMKVRDPVNTAGQQVAFECWLEEMTEDHYEAVDACGLNPALWVVAQQTTVVTPPAPAPAARTYLVFFDFDRSDITPEAASIIRQAADDAKRTNVRLIVATGHADRSGPTDYNQRLSERRAAAVKGALVREGIAAGTIQTSGRGENDNLVATPDGVREPRNRRVEIAFR